MSRNGSRRNRFVFASHLRPAMQGNDQAPFRRSLSCCAQGIAGALCRPGGHLFSITAAPARLGRSARVPDRTTSREKAAAIAIVRFRVPWAMGRWRGAGQARQCPSDGDQAPSAL